MSPAESRSVTRPEAVRVWLLGGFKVSVRSRTIEGDAWRLKKAAALVKLLAIAPGHRLRREQAMDLLWSNLGTKAAANNLRQTLHAARTILDPTAGSRYLASEDESLVLCPGGSLWVDVEVFEEVALTARRSRDPAAYRAALDLYTGDLLPEDRYEEWTQGRREELRQLYLALLIEAAGLYEGRDQYEQAIHVLRMATTKEPTLEEAHVGLMRLHARSGRPERALAQYERLRDALSRTLGTQPTATTRQLRDEIAAGRLPPAPLAGPSPQVEEELSAAGRHNLPNPRTSFVGREREMVEVKRTLAMTRLLTLTGAGGSGKTRLALEVARDLISAYPDGVWLVEFAPLSEPELVAQEVAGALEVQERPGQPLADTLADALGDKGLLLVLDNCEHLVEAAARLVDTLLDSCPRLRVLATSREPLGVGGEVLWQVPPLSLPDTDGEGANGDATVERLMRCEAVRLFVERARLRLPDFRLTDDNTGAVARVCRRLEGIPLAIELATARMGTLAVEQVAQRLEVSLIDVLKGASRTAEPRQQTLRATLDWSYNLLSEAEQTLFARLSAFAGGWTLEVAEAVCSGGSIEQSDVLDLLGGLVDKSLAVAGASTSGAVRYRMLEPIRQYAWEKLEESGEAAEFRRRHTEYFLVLAEETESKLIGPEQGEWLAQLESEHDNFRMALSWAFGPGDAELGLRLGSALFRFWIRRGHANEGRGWLERGLAERRATSVSTQAAGLETLGMLVEEHGELEPASALYKEALALHQKLEDHQNVADCQYHLGGLAIVQGDYERATELLESGLWRYQRLADPGGVAFGLAHLAMIAYAQSDNYEQATELLEEALSLCAESGEIFAGAMTLGHLGWITMARGDYGRARDLLEEALVRVRGVGVKQANASLLTRLALAVLGGGDHELAIELLKEGLELSREKLNKLDITRGIEGMAMVAAATRNGDRTATLWGAAEVSREVIGAPLRLDEREVYEPYVTAARAEIGEEAWGAKRKEGRKMTLEEAAEYALDKEEPATPTPHAPGRYSSDQWPSSLTPREQEVAVLVARGLTNRQIAPELSISEHTVANHIASILKKLELHSRAQLAAWVVEGRTPP